MASDTPISSGYEYPIPFQPQGKAAWRKKPIAKRKNSVIRRSTAKKPIVKKRKK